MFEGFRPETIDFLWGIRFNNNREWFLAHKDAYQQELYQPMQELARAVGEQFQLEGTILKTARIYRDARYCDGIPYKEHLWFCIRQDNVFWSEHPSLYFQIEPEGGSYGFIHYAPKAAMMELHRKRLLEKPKEFQGLMDKLYADTAFQDRSAHYKRPKPGGCPEIEQWYQMKNCFLIQEIPAGEELFSKELPKRLATGFQQLTPIYQYFRSLEDALQRDTEQ